MSTLIEVIVPCQHAYEDGSLCEDDVRAVVEATPEEIQTWDYPGSGEEWDVLSMELCRHGHVRLTSEYKEMAQRAIGLAKELADPRSQK